MTDQQLEQVTTEQTAELVRQPDQLKQQAHLPIGVRLFRVFALALAVLLVLVIMAAAILVIADVGQRNRVQRQYADLAGGGSFAEVNGTLIHFRKSGPSPDPLALAADKPPLVLIHGLMGSSLDFALIQPDLARTRTVVAVDLIGFGLSDKSASLNFSKKSMADDIAGLMEQLGYDQYDLLGHSMGGEVALNLALSYPDRVTRLVLLDSAGTTGNGPFGSVDAEAAGSGGTGSVGKTGISPLLIDLALKNYYFEKRIFKTCLHDPDPFMPEAFEKLYYFVQQLPAETLSRFVADSDSGAIASRLGEIRQPTHIIWGKQDRIIPVSEGEALQAAIPGSQLQVIDQCGHLPYLEQPEKLVDLVETFLAMPLQ